MEIMNLLLARRSRNYVGGIERLKAQDEAGVDVHQVEIDASSPAEYERIVAQLL
jgi:hypothetical protein